MENNTPDVASSEGSATLPTEEQMLSQGYGIAPNKLIFDSRIPDGAKLLYMYITALSAATGVCWPKNKTLGEAFSVSTRQITRWLTALEEIGYIELEFDNPNERTGKRKIYTVGLTTSRTKMSIVIDKNVYSNRHSATEITETINKSNNKSNKYTDAERSDLHRLYTLYLIKHKIPPHKLTDATDEEKRALLEAAKNKYRMTDKREAKVLARIRDAGPEMVAKAIVNVSKSEWHMGENPDGKKYNELAEFICRSYEQVEKWANMEDES